MTIERADFEEVSESDLNILVDAQVPEGIRLEYKLTTYNNSNDDKLELLKDFSALANSHGGHLVLGVQEKGGVATKIVGIDGLDPDKEIQRLEQITRSGLEPPVAGVRIRAIPLESGCHVILVRIPRSWYPPHRVVRQGRNRFYMRNSAGVYQPDVEELRTLFTQSASTLEQARRFRDDRIQNILMKYRAHDRQRSGILILHIVPVAAFSGMVNLDVGAVHAKDKIFRPMESTVYTQHFNFYGFINERVKGENYGYTQIFRNGVLEAMSTNIINKYDGHFFIRSDLFEDNIFEVFSSYIDGLRDVRVPPPLIIMFTLEGVLGVEYIVEQNKYKDPKPTLPEDSLKLPECVLEDYGTNIDYHNAVRPAFDALWNASGISESKHFNKDGLWVGASSRQ